MRRIAPWILAALVCAPALLAVDSAGREAAGRVRAAANDLIEHLLVPAASAQEVLEFKPVSPESAAKLDEARPPRRRRVPSVAPAPPVPPVPEVPEAPRAPIAIGKSGNIMRVGSDIVIEADQVVVGDVLAVSGDITVDGHVEGDVVAMGGDVYVHSGGRVDGDVVCMGGELHEDEGAVIGGQRVTAGRRGKIRLRDEGEDRPHRGGIAGPVIWLMITLGIAWAFAGLAPGRTRRALEVLKHEPGVSAGTGLLAAMLTVPSIVALCLLVALLCITIIGIPLAIGALFGYFAFLGVLWVWGYVIGAAAIGEAIARRAQRPGAMAPGQAAGASWPGQAGAAGGTDVAAAPVAAGAPADATSVMRAALYGVLVIGGAGLLGKLFDRVGVGGIGTLLIVLSWIAFSALSLVGAGAWLRAEIKAGTLSRLWGARRRTPAPAAPAAAAVAPEAGSAGAGPAPTGGPPVTPAGV